MPEERWLPAVGFEEDYEISNQGRMRRIRSAGPVPTGYVLKPKPDHHGYLRSTVRIHGKRYNIAIHHLVLETFVGPRPSRYVSNHKNGIKADNYVENLEWVTQGYNVRHAIQLGNFSFTSHGESHPNAKLTADDVRSIRCLYTTGDFTLGTLAERFGVSDVQISNVVNRKSWKHIP